VLWLDHWMKTHLFCLLVVMLSESRDTILVFSFVKISEDISEIKLWSINVLFVSCARQGLLSTWYGDFSHSWKISSICSHERIYWSQNKSLKLGWYNKVFSQKLQLEALLFYNIPILSPFISTSFFFMSIDPYIMDKQFSLSQPYIKKSFINMRNIIYLQIHIIYVRLRWTSSL
jgi:hypothetical protein